MFVELRASTTATRPSRFIRRYKDAYRTNTIKQYVAGDRIVRQWILEACQQYGITATIEGSLDMKLNLTQMADGYSGQEHSFPLAPLYKDVVEFVARTKTFYTPTILVAYGAPWSENYWFETEAAAADAKLRRWVPWELLDGMVRRRAAVVPARGVRPYALSAGRWRDIVHAGGRAALGSHGQLQGLGAHWETWNLRVGRADAARDAARGDALRGRGHRPAAGRRVARGRASSPTSLVLDRNPLENIRHTTSLRYVMKNGELFEAATLDVIWPEARPLPKPFWWDTEPAARK